MGKQTILIIEDNPDTRRFLEVMLGKDFEVISAENGVTGIEFARNQAPDLILLDIMMPVLTGYDTCSLLKKDDRTKHIPVIYLSAKNTVTDITHGLGLGADDYIPKPFDYKELKARIEARLRSQSQITSNPVVVGELNIDPGKREVKVGGKTISLTLTEFDLLRFLAENAGEIISRDQILKEVWKNEDGKANDRTIDVHVRALRKKIPKIAKYIVSVYGSGYKYEKG